MVCSCSAAFVVVVALGDMGRVLLRLQASFDADLGKPTHGKEEKTGARFTRSDGAWTI